ncbi:LysR family transcriptional regulator [Bradyrhizobium sp. RD5-C2]|uniref:LysR family transcriptional regulator n=1 Tax=Bradyrhizobium sp. RD5-C2 TaxID=244562 RepID=UPI001CC6144B|nr:LysR family transcriptional regulator [Bradyrhizobium sp. RD5-C2]GIQ77828.1 LysR family transcriptional regulator [Bradyrhizobium sp. RD5-C2]
MFDTINWDDLRVFLCAARAGNLSQTAKRLRLDHSTVSRRIAQMEASLGIAVFERHRTGLKLNEVGERLLRHAERVESAVIAIREEASASDTQGLIGTVRLATMEGIASLYLAQRFAKLRRTAPQLSVELVTSAQTVYVHKREADLFVSFFRPPGPGLISERIGKFRLGLFASQSYLDHHGTPASLRDLADHWFVSYIEDLIQVDSVRWLADVIEEPKIAFHSNSMIAQMNAAAGGLGIVMLPSFATNDRPDLIPVLPALAGTFREVWLNVHSDLQFAPRIRAVRAFLKNTLKQDPDMQVTLADALPQPRTADCKNP